MNNSELGAALPLIGYRVRASTLLVAAPYGVKSV